MMSFPMAVHGPGAAASRKECRRHDHGATQ
jgi:hypothetical protein